jgi:transcriptional regulator with GAF, ATPase, and Fis domain
VQPVFDAVADRAMRLLDCWSVIVTRFDGEYVQFGAARGALPDTEQFVRQRYRSMRPYRASLLGRSLLERTVVNCADAQAEPDPQLRDYAHKRGLRAVLVVPLLRDDKVEGALVLSRAEPGLFAPREIELVQTFADQAVIAIQNARLFNETKQALEHQTATSEVLQVIGNSMADAKPVFERIVNSIERLFDCRQMAIFVTPGDGLVHLAARRGMNMELMDEVYPLPIEQSAVPCVYRKPYPGLSGNRIG